MRDVETLKGLLKQVRDATAPNEDLDAEILIGAGVLTRIDRLAGADATSVWEYRDAGRNQAGPHHPMVLRATGSIDAAVALVGRVLPGWSWEVRRSGFGTPAQAILHDPMRQPAPGYDTRVDHPAGVPALALCAALLSALIAQAQEAPRHGE